MSVSKKLLMTAAGAGGGDVDITNSFGVGHFTETFSTTTAPPYYPSLTIDNIDNVDMWGPQTNDSDALFLNSGTHTWVAPAGVTSVCILCIGGGAGGGKGGTGGGGGAGGLGYKNNYSVTPGNSYEVKVGQGGTAVVTYSGSGAGTNGETSHFKDGATVVCSGIGGTASGSGGSYTGDGGGSGGSGNSGFSGGGGGAGGYSGSGGNGSTGSGSAGAGGGGGGGSGNNGGTGGWGGLGGSTGFFGEGSNGAGGSTSSAYGVGGAGGSGGAFVLTTDNWGSAGNSAHGTAGRFVVGAGGAGGSTARSASYGGGGMVRITWRSGASFPSTNVEPDWSGTDYGYPMNICYRSGSGSLPTLFWHKNNTQVTRVYMYTTALRHTGEPFSGTYDGAKQGYFKGALVPQTNGIAMGQSFSSSDTVVVPFAPLPKFYVNVEYTGDGNAAGQTISHGLGAQPAFMLGHGVSINTGETYWYHEDISSTPEDYGKGFRSTGNDTGSTDSTWANTAPTGSQFSVGGSLNSSGVTYVLHLFAEVPGRIDMGAWTGDGSSTGTQTIDCGLVGDLDMLWWKQVNGTNSDDWWRAVDRYGMSGDDFSESRYLGKSAAFDAVTTFSRTAGGFLINNNPSYNNESGGEYIYVAFGAPET